MLRVLNLPSRSSLPPCPTISTSSLAPSPTLRTKLRSTDGKAHDVSVLFSASGELAVNTPDQLVDVKQEENPHLIVFKIGSTDQAVLGKAGDDLRIDWGYLYVAAPRTGLGAPTGVAAKSGAPPQPAGTVTAHISFDLKGVTDEPVSRWLMLAYDDLYSIQYMKKNLRPYWRRNGWEAADLLTGVGRRLSAPERTLRRL